MDGYTLAEKMRKVRRRNRLTATEQALFHELVAVCNSEGWEDVFSCPNIELCCALNIDEKTLIRARLSLINAGLIYYKSGKSKRIVGLYSFEKSFENSTTGKITVDEPSNQPANMGANQPANAPDYIKTKIKTNNSLSPTCAYEEIPPGVFEKSLDECYLDLKSNQTWMEQFCVNIRSSGYKDFTPAGFYDYLEKFFMKLQNEGKTKKSPQDAQSHFTNWLRIELEKLKKDENNRKLSKEDKIRKLFGEYQEAASGKKKSPTDEEILNF